MNASQLQLAPFADPLLTPEALLHRLGHLREAVAPAMARRMNYYRNPATPLASFLPSARSLTLNARLYRQYQEVGLPTRITGFRQTPEGLPIPAGSLDIQRKEVVIENDIAWRINTIADFAIGEMPIINSTSPDAARRQRITGLLQAILDSNGGATLLTQMVLLGVIHGVSYVTIRPQEQLLQRLAKTTGETPVPQTGTPGEAGSDIASIDATLAAPADDAAWASCVRLSIVEAPRVLPIFAGTSTTSLPELAYAAILQTAQQPDAGGAQLQLSALRRIAGWLRGGSSPPPSCLPGTALNS